MDEAAIRRWISQEVEVRVRVMYASIEEVAKQNDLQSKEIQLLKTWQRQLWANGTGGPPGYLENAHRENKETAARQEREVKEGFAELRQQIVELSDRAKREDGAEAYIRLEEERTTRRLNRWKAWVGVLGACGVGSVLAYALPILKALVRWVALQIN